MVCCSSPRLSQTNDLSSPLFLAESDEEEKALLSPVYVTQIRIGMIVANFCNQWIV